MSDTVTHLAGVVITLGRSCRVIQRCAICGEKMCDSLNAAMPLNPDGTRPTFPTWQPGHFVRYTVAENPRRETALGDLERLPDDSCAELLE